MDKIGETSAADTSESLHASMERWLKSRLAGIYTQEGVELFWNNPNAILGGASPADMLKTDPERVRNYIDTLES